MAQHLGRKSADHRTGAAAWLPLLACLLSGAIWAAEKPETNDARAQQKSAAPKQPSLGDADNTGDPVEDVDRDSNDDFSDLVVPVEALANVKTMDRLKFAQTCAACLWKGCPNEATARRRPNGILR